MVRAVATCVVIVATMGLVQVLDSPAYADEPPVCPNPTPTAVAVDSVPIECHVHDCRLLRALRERGWARHSRPGEARGRAAPLPWKRTSRRFRRRTTASRSTRLRIRLTWTGTAWTTSSDPSPLNHSHRVELDPADGAMVIADHAHFEELAYLGPLCVSAEICHG